MYTVTLANGTALTQLELNGNNYISSSILEDAVFKGNLGTVTIFDGTNSTTYTDMILIQNTVCDERSWFILAEKTDEDKAKEVNKRIITDLQSQLEATQTAVDTLLFGI